MKKNVEELHGAELDYWAAKSLGQPAKIYNLLEDGAIKTTCVFEGEDNCGLIFNPSERWDHIGPYMNQHKIFITDYF